MANLVTVVEAGRGHIRLSTSQSLDASVRLVPGDPPPVDAARASESLRIQQLSFLSHQRFPLIPAYNANHLGLLYPYLLPFSNFMWFGSIVQFRPNFNKIMHFRPLKLIGDMKQQILECDQGFSFKEMAIKSFKDAAKCLYDLSPFSIQNCAQFVLDPTTTLSLSAEGLMSRGQRKRFKTMLHHQREYFDVAVEAAWPELYIDHKGRYWEVPESMSLNVSSDSHEPGFQYLFGLQTNRGHPRAVNDVNDEPPSALLPGLCAKATFSYEASRDLWRPREIESLLPSYDISLGQPHATISGIIGARCAAWFLGRKDSVAVSRESSTRGQFDLFGSVCCTLQHGQFKKRFGDLTRVDARMDICSASAFSRRVLDVLESSDDADNPLASPRLNLIFQQQVGGPIVLRVDSQIKLDFSCDPHVEDLIYSLNYSIKEMESAKVVAWYSPIRKEGMVEFRIYEL